MKRTLYLLRHAKAVPHHDHGSDHDRILLPRGRDDSYAMGEYLARQGFRPEKILCSTSARTRETREAMAPSYGELPATEYREELYLASPQQILALLRETPDTIGSVMVIGHNPGIHQCALHLAMNDASPAYRQLLFDFPTAALAVLSFADLAHWQEIQAGNGAVDAYAVGRKLG